MKRRDFLTISLMGFGALLAPSQVQGMTSDMLLKSFAGQALGSTADPLLWKGLANLGQQYNVLGVFQDLGTYYAKVSFQGHIFFLKSTDRITWYTSDWTTPSTLQVHSAEKNHG